MKMLRIRTSAGGGTRRGAGVGTAASVATAACA